MPLTSFQSEVLEVLRGQRAEGSHFAGGMVLNAPPDSARYSHDFDFFHDAVSDLITHSESDFSALEEAGFPIKKVEKYGPWGEGDTFRKAHVGEGEESFDLDWAFDSAYRFFPIEEDPLLGWRLHLFDMAINKALALSARSETRDYLDIVELGRRFPLAAIAWVDQNGTPAWIGDNPNLKLHPCTLRGCWPSISTE